MNALVSPSIKPTSLGAITRSPVGYRVDTLMAQHADAKLTDPPLTLADSWTNGQVQRMNRTIRFKLRAVEPCAKRRPFSGGEASFALAMEWRLLRRLRPFPRRPLKARFPPI
jgi:hypothetical protein